MDNDYHAKYADHVSTISVNLSESITTHETDDDLDDYPVLDRFEFLKDQLGSNTIVPVFVLCPFLTFLRMPQISESPVMRTIAALVCIIDITSFLSAGALYARLRWAKLRGFTKEFEQDVIKMRESDRGRDCYVWSSPMFLFTSAFVLFFVILLGHTWNCSYPTSADAGVQLYMARSPLELAVLAFISGCALLHIVYVVDAVSKLGNRCSGVNVRQTDVKEVPGEKI